uniref:C2H2-type domain-containing protein n=1 Tax=Anopheles coluzzii TaxID=1518534 RepID=A0A8W7P753_ANOCL
LLHAQAMEERMVRQAVALDCEQERSVSPECQAENNGQHRNKFECEHCVPKKYFQTARNVSVHIQTVHFNKENKKRKCQECNGVCNSESDIPVHYLLAHKELPGPYQCLLYAIAELTHHFHAHTDRERDSVSVAQASLCYRIENCQVNQCKICRQNFTTKGAITKHWMMHTDRRYVCAQCGQSFREERLYRRHVAEKHPATNCEHRNDDDLAEEVQGGLMARCTGSNDLF